MGILTGNEIEQNKVGEEVDISAQIKERMEDILLRWGNYCSSGGWIPQVCSEQMRLHAST